jgi:hypothetical protein
MMTEQQIAHLEKHQADFDQLQGFHRPVREYAQEYSHIEDLYIHVCNDLGIAPVA